MKKHQILSLCLYLFLALLLTNCSKTNEPQPVLPAASLIGLAGSPSFADNDPDASSLENLTVDFARFTSTLNSSGTSPIIQIGHVWSSTMNYPTVGSSYSEIVGYSALGMVSASEIYPFRFTSYVRNLDANTTYYIRAYATTKDGTFYGATHQFKTLSRTNF